MVTVLLILDTYLGPSQTSMMEVFFKKMVDGYISLTIFALNLLRISTQPLQTHHVDSTLSFKRGMHVVCL